MSALNYIDTHVSCVF